MTERRAQRGNDGGLAKGFRDMPFEAGLSRTLAVRVTHETGHGDDRWMDRRGSAQHFAHKLESIHARHTQVA